MKTLEQLGISPAPWTNTIKSKITFETIHVWDAMNGGILTGGYAEALNDARLIAASPKLYAACYEMLRYYYEQNTNTTVFNTALELMKQAIAEAAGESEVEK